MVTYIDAGDCGFSLRKSGTHCDHPSGISVTASGMTSANAGRYDHNLGADLQIRILTTWQKSASLCCDLTISFNQKLLALNMLGPKISEHDNTWTLLK
jgi:hypothetical protein